MKTKVRIIKDQKSGYSDYSHFYIQLLYNPYPNSDTLNIYGTIKFQKGGNDTPSEYYAMAVECNSDKIDHFLKCAKILQAIQTNTDTWNPQPKEVLNIIGAVEHVTYNGYGFIPVTWNGYKMYKVLTAKKEHYSTIFAPSLPMAEKERIRKKFLDHELEYLSTVEI